MVMKTLSLHISLLKIGIEDWKGEQGCKGVVSLASTTPYGALMISIQAVCNTIIISVNVSQMVVLGSTCAHVCQIR